MHKDCVDLKVPASPKMMRLVRRTVSQACEIVGFSEREMHAVTLAVDEGCTNIIRHCYQGDENHEIIVRLRLCRDRIEIMLRDFGGEIDVDKLHECAEKRKKEIERQETVQAGGLGVMLIHSIMDRVQYKTSRHSGTVLRLIKYTAASKEEKVADRS